MVGLSPLQIQSRYGSSNLENVSFSYLLSSIALPLNAVDVHGVLS
jgi:hypothetical protein